MYWGLISRVQRQVGRKQTPQEIRELIFQMVVENPTWGAPHIHGELLMLGFDLSERNISRWMKRAPRDPDRTKRWLVSFETVGKPLRPWISSPRQRSLSACSTASSSMTYGSLFRVMIFTVRRPTLARWYRYHGQTTANHRQTMCFEVCLEWFGWAISYVRGSQVVRRGVLCRVHRHPNVYHDWAVRCLRPEVR